MHAQEIVPKSESQISCWIAWNISKMMATVSAKKKWFARTSAATSNGASGAVNGNCL